MSHDFQQGRRDMAMMLRLRTLGVACVACASGTAGAVSASAAPTGADTLQSGSRSPDVLRAFDPDQREFNRARHHWRRSWYYRHHHGRHLRHLGARERYY
jgi:hypothetical protein